MKVRVFKQAENAIFLGMDWEEAIAFREIETVEEIDMDDSENVDDYMAAFYPQYEDGDKYGFEVIG